MAKKILEEGTVRRFMKIAGLQPLSESFVDNLEEEVVEEVSHDDEDSMEEGYGKKPKEPMAEEAEEEMEMGSEEPEAMKEPEEEVEVDMPDEGMMDEDEKVDLLQKLAQALGVDVEVEADEEPEMGPEEPKMDDAGPEGEEDVMEEGEHMEEPAKDPAGHSLESLPLVGDADSRDPNQSPKTKEQDPTKAPGSKHMAESREAFKNRIVEQVAKRVAQRLKNLK